MYAANGSVQDCAAKVREAVFGRKKPAEDERYFYGRGFAALMKSPKGAPHQTKGCYLKLNKDGSVTVTIGGLEVGQGLRTVVQQVAGEALKVPPHKVRVNFEVDTLYSPYEWQTIGSMFTTMGGRAIIRAADRVIAILKKNASYAFRCDEDFIEYDGQWLFVKTDPDCRVAVRDVAQGYMLEDGRTVGELAQATSDARLPRYSGFDEHGQGGAGVSYTFGAQACELRIEKSTGKVTIDHFASSFDVGKVVNPRQIRGQVAGGVLMAIGATLYEKLQIECGRKDRESPFREIPSPVGQRGSPPADDRVCGESRCGRSLRGARHWRASGHWCGSRNIERGLRRHRNRVHGDSSDAGSDPGRAQEEGDAEMKEHVTFKLNGRDVSIGLSREKKLLEILREDLGVTGTKCGCDSGVCGACTVVLDGKEVKSCLYSSEKLDGVEVLTIEGLSVNSIHPIQKALIDAGAVQCGYCTPGIVMGLYALFDSNPGAEDAEIMKVLDRHLCRCTGYEALVEGAKAARSQFSGTGKR